MSLKVTDVKLSEKPKGCFHKTKRYDCNSYGWVLECVRPFSDNAPSLAGAVQNSIFKQTSGCSILSCLLFCRVECFWETLLNSTSSWGCAIAVFISILQLQKLNHLIHSKSILTNKENKKSVNSIWQCRSKPRDDSYSIIWQRNSFLVLSKGRFCSKHY